MDTIKEHQSQVKKLFDKKARSSKFQVGDFVLLWYKHKEPKGWIASTNPCGKDHSRLYRYVRNTCSI